jgi:spore maturation protein CgeB
MNARVWELAAMGIPAVQNTVPDMKTFFVAGEHYLQFTDMVGAVDQVLNVLNDYEKAQEIANAAYRKVQPHTYDARISQILERVGLKKNGNNTLV